jgi:hypothetical protein
MEKQRLRVLEVITSAKDVKELISLDLEIAEYISLPQRVDLLFLMVSSRDQDRHPENAEAHREKEENWLDDMAQSLEVFWEASEAINKRLFELVPDSKTLTSVLQVINDEELRKRLLWRWDRYHQSSQIEQSL